MHEAKLGGEIIAKLLAEWLRKVENGEESDPGWG